MDIPASAIYTSSNNDKFFRKRYTASFSFAAGIILFLLPFAELKCSSVTLAGNTGTGIAFGKKWKVTMTGENSEFMDKINEEIKGGKNDVMKTGINPFALGALVVGFLGLMLTFINHKLRPAIGICTGILAALLLIALMVHFKILLRSSLNSKGKDSPYDMGMILKIQFTIWYYISLISFAAAAFFSYQHHKIAILDARSKLIDFDFQRMVE